MLLMSFFFTSCAFVLAVSTCFPAEMGDGNISLISATTLDIGILSSAGSIAVDSVPTISNNGTHSSISHDDEFDDVDDDFGGRHGDDDDDFVDGKEPCHSHLFFIIIYGPLFGIVCGVGILGNSLSFAVLHADPPTRFRKHSHRPRLLDQFSVERSVGGISHYRQTSQDSSDKRHKNRCYPGCCAARRKSSQRSFHKRSDNSVTSVTMVTLQPKPANVAPINSIAILKRITKHQSSRTNIWGGAKRKVKGQAVSSYLLIALAITDNVYLATSALVQIYSAVAIYFGREKEFEKVFYYLQKYFWPVNYLAQLGTVWMMVLVAANRYIAVCKPLHATRLCTRAKVRRQIIILAVSLLLYNVPRFFEFDYRPHDVSNATNISSKDDDALINHGLVTYPIYNILYENVAYCLVAFFLPLSILIFFNVRLMATLRSAEKFRPPQFSASTSAGAENLTPNTKPQSFLSPGAPSTDASRSPFQVTQSSSTPSLPAPPNSAPSSTCRTKAVLGTKGEQRTTSTETATTVLASESIVIVDPDRNLPPASPLGRMPRDGPPTRIGHTKTPANADERNVTLVMIIIILAFITCESPAAVNQILFYLVDRKSRTTCSPYMWFYHVSNLLIVLNSALNFFIYFLFRKKFQTQLWSLFSCRSHVNL